MNRVQETHQHNRQTAKQSESHNITPKEYIKKENSYLKDVKTGDALSHSEAGIMA